MSKKSELSALRALHRKLNAGTQAQRAQYADCRARVMAMIASAPGTGSVAVLGAGNCNDVELDALVSRFDDVHLMDIDGAAMAAAIERASLQGQVRTLACDLSGTYAKLRRWRRRPPGAAALGQLIAGAGATLPAALAGTFDCVVSSLVLSQLVHTSMVELGRSHPALRAVATASVLCHIEMAAALVSADGTLVLAVDTLARPRNELARALAQLSPDELLLHAEARGMCLPGTEVSFVVRALQERFPDANMDLSPAWVWSPGHQSHLVYGLVVRRARASGA